MSVGTSPFRKDKDWAVREKEIEDYWIKELEVSRKEWEAEKEKEVQSAVESVRAQADRTW